MKAVAMVLAAGVLLAGCVSGDAGGTASYDALKRAKDACTTKGGTFVLKSGDPTWIGNYACERK